MVQRCLLLPALVCQPVTLDVVVLAVDIIADDYLVLYCILQGELRVDGVRSPLHVASDERVVLPVVLGVTLGVAATSANRHDPDVCRRVG